MPALEVLVGLDHAVGVLVDIGTQDLRGDPGVVHDGDGLADVVAQRRHHHLIGCPRFLGPGRRLQGVDELIDLEAVGDLFERGQHVEHTVGHTGLVFNRLDDDVLPLLGRRFVHTGERHGAIIALAAS